MRYYTYLILDPRIHGTFSYDGGKLTVEYLPIYGGKGCYDRCNDHIKEAIESDKKSHKLNKLRKILKAGREPIIIKIIENVDEETAFDKERELIWIVGRADLNMGPLTNLTWGGEGTGGLIHSVEHRRKNSEALKKCWKNPEFRKNMIEKSTGKNNAFFGKAHSKETIEKISKSKTGSLHTEETKSKMSKTRKGKKFSEAHKKAISESRLGEKHHLFGKSVSEETRKKMSEAHKKRYRDKKFVHSKENKGERC